MRPIPEIGKQFTLDWQELAITHHYIKGYTYPFMWLKFDNLKQIGYNALLVL